MRTSRPEHQILICIAHRDLDSREVNNLQRLFDSPIDWDYLITTARQHALLPLLHKHASSDRIPGHVRSTLKRESVMNAQSVLFLTGKALEVQKLLNAHSIENALFKGPLLSELAYGEVSLRQAGDIDLLIRREDFKRAKELLLSLGYQMHPQLTPAQQASHLAFHCEIQFVRDDWFTVVDLHWGLSPRSFVFGLTEDEVMSRLQTVSFAGDEVKTFSADDLILYQAMHGAKHLWRRLEWIASLAELVLTLEASSWSEVVERTIKARATRILALGLRLAENLGVELPVQVIKILDGEDQMKKFANKIWNEMFSARTWADSMETNIFNMKVMDRRRDALASMMAAIFVPTLSDWQALPLPTAMHPLYYAIRPMRLTKIYSASILRRLLRS
jgi:putative nucleotidyltransferase-like protein